MVRKNVPLALQVMNDIITGIESGDLVRDNGQLPSEDELSKRFEVSRSTVREALSKLEQRGTVTRQHGIGTFVTSKPMIIDTGLEQLESLDTLARRMGLETQVGESQIVERAASLQEAEQLQIPAATPVLAVNRLIMAGGQPVAYLVDVIPTTFLRAQDLEKVFTGSILDIFIKQAAPALSHALTDITVEKVDGPIADKLNLHNTDVLLKLESLLFSRDGKRIDYSFSYFIPGYFRFHVVRRVNPGEIFSPQET